MTITEAKENLESNVENIFVKLNKAEQRNRILVECLAEIKEVIKEKGSRGILNIEYRIDNALEGK